MDEQKYLSIIQYHPVLLKWLFKESYQDDEESDVDILGWDHKL